MCTKQPQKPIFRDLTAEDPDPEVTEVESFCVNCHSNGITRLLLTRIPFYKNVVLMSFSCEECGYENNEIQPGGAFAENGVRWRLSVEQSMDLNRQVVKSDYTAVKIPELDFEIPAKSQKGEVTTVEGIISRVIAGLSQDQEVRRIQHPTIAENLDSVIEKLQQLKNLDSHWTLELEDISGNTFIENPVAPSKDPRCKRTEFKRNKDEDHALGIFSHEEVQEASERSSSAPSDAAGPAEAEVGSYERLAADEVLTFRTNCPHCDAPADTNMKLTDVPHFKQVVIMATNCDACGLRTNEVKSGSGIEEKGVRFEVRLATKEDFNRDILKSDTCSMAVPELELEAGGAALGGRFSTGEGLLRAAGDQLRAAGDAPTLAAHRMDGFLKRLDEVLELQLPVTLILDDPAGNSYVQSLNEQNPQLPDDGLKIIHYERSFEQNEELGLNDMKTEGYENDT